MMDHLMDIATQQIVTIARAAAYRCDEQHEYMNGAGGTNWFPHKWVVEAMRAAVTIRNTQAEDMVREELHQTRAQLAEAHALLQEIRRKPGLFSGDFILRLDETLSASAEPRPFRTPDCPDCACVQDGQCLCSPSKPSAEPSEPVERDERAEFEDWSHCNWPGAQRQQLERDDFGAYKNPIYRDFWTGWQARAALERKP